MQLHKLNLRNVVCFDSYELELGKKLTLVEGRNGQGKTTIARAIAYALRGGTGMLRIGEEEADIVAVLDDGLQIERGIVPGRRIDPVLRHPAFGKLKNPATTIRRMIDDVAMDINDFLRGKPQDRVKTVLESFPMALTLDEVAGETGMPVELVAEAAGAIGETEPHALELLGRIEAAWEESRRSANAIAKDKLATLNQFGELTDKAADGTDWPAKLRKLREAERQVRQQRDTELNELRMGNAKRIFRIKSAGDQRRGRVQEDRVTQLEYAKNEYAAAEAEARAAYELAVRHARAALDQKLDAINSVCNAQIATITSETEAAVAADQETLSGMEAAAVAPFEERLTEIATQIGHAEAQAQAASRNAAIQEMRRSLRDAFENADNTAMRLNHGIQQVRALRGSLVTARCPMPGLGIIDGDVAINDVPWSTMNTQAKVDLFVALALARAARFDLKLVVIDNLECLDSEHWQQFVQRVTSADVQVVATRVSDTDLTVTRIEQGEEVA